MSRPNILFLLSDEHSYRFMGHVDDKDGGENAVTPALDALAAKGNVFMQSYCQMPLCTPSRMCLLTGRDVNGCGAWNNQSVLLPDIETIPGYLSDNGYDTCLVGKMHFGGRWQHCGFQERPYGDLTGRTGHQSEPVPDPDHSMRGRITSAGYTTIPESQHQEQIVSREVITYLREHEYKKPDQPWFMCASFSRPHFPLNAPKRHLDYYLDKGVSRPKVGASGDAYNHPMSIGMRYGFACEGMGYDEMMYARAAYFANVTYLDEIIGDMLGTLERDGLLENTIIIYTTDHGEMAGEHGVWYKNGWYEACTRVPFIISTPEQRSGLMPAKVIDTPVSLADLFPTVCSLTKLLPPDGLNGTDLSPSIFGDADVEPHPVYCDVLIPRWGEGCEFRMLRDGDYKLVVFKNAPTLMFDVINDPGEQHNIIDSEDEGIKTAKARMRSLIDESMDFDAASAEREEQDDRLKEEYAIDAPYIEGGNVYLMPDKRVVYADSVLYNPMVLSDNPSEFFLDYKDNNE